VFYWIMKHIVIGPILLAIFRPWVVGLEHVPKQGPVILASNHLSFIDSIFLPLVVDRPVVFLAKSEYFTGKGLKGWATRLFFQAANQLPIDRSGGKASEASLNTGLRVLGEGRILGIYPEGTRSPDGRLYRGRTGVARLALGSNSPVVPIGLIGSREVMPKGAKFPKLRGHITVKFGPPLTFEKYADNDNPRVALRAMTDEIMFAIMEQSGQTYVDEYASRDAAPKPAPEDMRIPTEEKLG
jgi:1-acyl-sn-glycerol-3-phosphate acyltransferase